MLRNAIDYIEEHLHTEHDIDAIARSAFVIPISFPTDVPCLNELYRYRVYSQSAFDACSRRIGGIEQQSN